MATPCLSSLLLSGATSTPYCCSHPPEAPLAEALLVPGSAEGGLSTEAPAAAEGSGNASDVPVGFVFFLGGMASVRSIPADGANCWNRCPEQGEPSLIEKVEGFEV